MKIAFWSNSPGKSGVTGNLSCISILSAMSEPSRMVLFENHASMKILAVHFLIRIPTMYYMKNNPIL